MDIGERFNTATHLGGALLAAIGSLYLLSQQWGGTWQGLASVAVYGGTLMLLYACSTLYHGSSGPIKERFRKFDHYAIYLLIAGTYTPFCALALNSSTGWLLLAVVWGLALAGIAQEVLQKGNRWLSVAIYLAMGWAAILLLSPLRASLGDTGFGLVAGGGLVYTVGIVFYIIDTRMRHAHGIWHLFVVLGSALHYAAIALYVLPAATA
ncbi:hemolysin III family protein [Pseudoduganella sp. LjRoot289]|uniref:PAQR family membrane homeostasis protein TrhA n=1 Tax=Pseudoduganella sp. LjRoot289 TaxID=3342314 RepID=UPI003ED11D4C